MVSRPMLTQVQTKVPILLLFYIARQRYGVLGLVFEIGLKPRPTGDNFNRHTYFYQQRTIDVSPLRYIGQLLEAGIERIMYTLSRYYHLYMFSS
jgi:hypothetical protein